MSNSITRFTRFEDLPELLRVEEAAAFADVSVGTLHELARRGELPVVKLGRMTRISKRTVANWLGIEAAA